MFRDVLKIQSSNTYLDGKHGKTLAKNEYNLPLPL